MCGLAGIFSDGGTLPADGLERHAGRMAETLAHRGPDGSGTWSDAKAGIAFGFRRLAIIDLSEHGRQPMHSPSGRYTMVFNGEVYNHRELRGQLEASGIPFRGHSDTEVILAAFDRWGLTDAIERFDGMFAIAVWDHQERALTLIRDRLGIKPLYIYHRDGLLTFASELKALVAGPRFDRTLSQEALTAYLRHLYVPAPYCIYRHAFKLQPGHILTVHDPELPVTASRLYWSLTDVAANGLHHPFEGSDEEAVDELEDRLRRAVSRRTFADVPVGALLSGGIDSSAVVSLMQSESSRPVRTFSIGFDAQEHNEADDAARVAAHLGTRHTELTISGEDALRVVPCLPEMFDEPFADPSAVPTVLVSRLARREVVVALSGDGGDELFGGYNRYTYGTKAIRAASAVPSALRHLLAAGLATLPPRWIDSAHAAGSDAIPALAGHRLLGGKVHKLADLMRMDSQATMYESLLSAWQRPADLLVRGAEPETAAQRIMADAEPAALLDRMMLADQAVYLPDDLLAKVDRASMAVGLEVRVPLLDHRVVELAWSLPASLKIRGGRTKWILRQLLHRRVPPAMVERPKVGFTVPIDGWLRGPLREWAGDLLSAAGAGDTLRADRVRAEWDAFQAGRSNRGLGLWAVLTFLSWRQRWGDG